MGGTRHKYYGSLCSDGLSSEEGDWRKRQYKCKIYVPRHEIGLMVH